METQAQAPAPAQAPTPVHPIIEEQRIVDRLTKYVRENPDNDPDHPEDSSTPRPPLEEQKAEEPQETQEGKEEPTETVEFDEESPVFELEYKTDTGKELKKLSLKDLREGYLAKQDYHRNIQKVKQQESQLQEQMKQAELRAQQEYMQRLEQHKQLVLKTVAPELQSVDLNKLAMEDPAEAQRLFFRQIQLNQTLQSIETEQKAAREKVEQEMAAVRARQVERSKKVLEEEIPNWGPDLYGKVLGTMVNDYGLNKQGVEAVAEAELIKVFHDAYQYRQLQKAKPEISKKVVAVPKVLKPGSADKANPASNAVQEAEKSFKKSGDWRDAAKLYLARQKQNKKG